MKAKIGISLAMLFGCVSLSAWAQTPEPAPKPVEAGLATAVKGDVLLTASGQTSPSPLKAFEKLWVGDAVEIPDKGLVRLIFFSESRQESWKGPCKLEIAASGAREASGTKTSSSPEVKSLSKDTGKSAALIPGLLKQARTASFGGSLIRHPEGGASLPPKAPQDDAALKQARTAYELMRKEAPQDDLSPELILLALLAEHGRWQEMATLIEKSRASFPDSTELDQVDKWVKQELKQLKSGR